MKKRPRPRVERDRLRERERQARAQMSSQVADQESPGPSGNFLFREPIRVNPSSADPVTQQIQSKLGDFQRVRHFLDQKDSGLIGVDGVPPSPGGPPPSRHHMPLPPGPVAGAPSRKRLLTWSRELSTKLIQLYESYPCLYRTKSPDYHNRNRRNEAYKEICEEVNKTFLTNFTPDDVKKEIHALRKQYFSEIDKIEKGEVNGSSPDLVYKPTLWCYDQLCFLNENPKNPMTSESKSQKAAFQSEAPDAELRKSDSQTTKSGSTQSNSSRNTSSKKRIRLYSREDIQQLTDPSELQNLFEEEPNANLLFGQMLASEMNKIDDENMVNRLKHDILNLLHEAKRKSRKT